VSDDTPSTLRLILRELPRRRVALVLLVVVVNLGVVTWWRGRSIAEERAVATFCMFGGISLEWELPRFVPPWEWTADECRETWPWK
jgi:hypothetical protein